MNQTFESPQRRAARHYRERHRKLGLCAQCPNKISPSSSSLCWRCLDKKRGKAPLCALCHTPIPEHERKRGRLLHTSCRKITIQRSLRASYFRFKNAERYKRAHLKAAKAYQERHIEAGLCEICPEIAKKDTRRCDAHGYKKVGSHLTF